MFFERFWRTSHHLTIKGAGPLFLLVGAFLVFFSLEPSAMAYFVQETADGVAAAGNGGVVSFVLIGIAAGLFVLCPLVSLMYLRRAQHVRGMMVLFPPLALSFASLSAWLMG